MSESFQVAREGSVARGGIEVPPGLVFGVACFCVTFLSGGLITGTGPFAGKLISEGYIDSSGVAIIFEGAFLILTWGAVVAAHLSGFLGPQLTSIIGMMVQLPGFLIFAFLPHPANVHVILVAYGLIGWGGYMIFVNSFHFALLFPVNFGVADSMLAGLFNASGLVFLILNAESISFKGFFRAYLGMFGLVFFIVLLCYPSVPYSKGDTPRIASARLRDLRNPCDFSQYRRHLGLLANTRFVMFAVQFSLATTVSTYMNGFVSEPAFDFGKEHNWYATWLVPIVTNTNIIFSGIVGVVIKRTGFGLVSLALAVTCTVSAILGLLPTSTLAAFVVPVLLNWMQAMAFTMQFVFLHVNTPGDAFTTGLVGVLCIQGCFNLIPWPIFSVVFGDNRPPALWILVCLSSLMYVWPVLELRRYGIRQQDTQTDSFLHTSFVEQDIKTTPVTRIV